MKDFSERPPFTKSAAQVLADIIEFVGNMKYADEFLAMLSQRCVFSLLRSKVEVGPMGARYYDLFMNVKSLGYYPYLVRRVVDKMDIQSGQSILELGSGMGRNDCFIARKIGPKGKILGLDISKEMLSLSRKRCELYPNVEFREQLNEAF